MTKRPKLPLRATARVVILVVVVAAISAGIGLGVGSFVRSPAQVAADAAPPQRSVVTADVVEGTIEDPLLIKGVVSPGTVMGIMPDAPAGVEAVVTGVPVAVGQTVAAGGVLIEVSDRPVILLTGEVPLLRDLRIGDRGEDVARLQTALSEWGAPFADGIFGAATARAIRTLYDAAGYSATTDAVALRSELVFAPSPTARVVAVGSALGAPAASPLIRVAISPPNVTAEVSEAVANRLVVGQTVHVSGAGIGGEQAGTISRMDGLGKSDDGAYRVPVQVVVNDSLPAASVDRPVQITVPPVDSERGLLIPLAAVFADAKGGTFVRLLDGGKQQRVTVTVAETGGGQARVNTLALAVGDRVVVGVG